MADTNNQNAPATTEPRDQFDAEAFFKDNLTREEDGSVSVKEGDFSPVEKSLLITEKRRRDAQRTMSHEKTRADKVTLELNKVKEVLPNHFTANTDEIDPNLKHTDPDAYIEQVLAAKAQDPYSKVFEEASEYASQAVTTLTMEQTLAAHNEAYPDKAITNDMLSLDLPPRLEQEFKAGKISSAEFLNQAADILYKPTKVVSPSVESQPNLSEVGGQTNPTNDETRDAVMANYENAIF